MVSFSELWTNFRFAFAVHFVGLFVVKISKGGHLESPLVAMSKALTLGFGKNFAECLSRWLGRQIPWPSCCTVHVAHTDAGIFTQDYVLPV